MAGTKPGRDTVVYANGFNVTRFLQDFSGPEQVLNFEDSTAFGDKSHVKTPTVGESDSSFSGIYDSDAAASHDFLKAAIGTAEDHFIVLRDGDAFGNVGFAMVGFETTYGLESPVEGIVTMAGGVTSRIGDEEIRVLQERATKTSTFTGATLDNLAATTNGGAAYLQAFAASGSSPTLDVTVRHSTDNFVGDDTLLATFVQVVVSRKRERVPIVGTIKQSVRIIGTIGGGSPSFELFAGLHRA